MPRFFATATISTEFEFEAENPKEANDYLRRALGIDRSDAALELITKDANGCALLLIDPLVTLGLVGEVSGPLG